MVLGKTFAVSSNFPSGGDSIPNYHFDHILLNSELEDRILSVLKNRTFTTRQLLEHLYDTNADANRSQLLKILHKLTTKGILRSEKHYPPIKRPCKRKPNTIPRFTYKWTIISTNGEP